MPPASPVGATFVLDPPDYGVYVDGEPVTTEEPRRGVVIAFTGDPRVDPETARVTVRYDNQEEEGFSLSDIRGLERRWRWETTPNHPERVAFRVSIPVESDDGWFWRYGHSVVVDVLARDHDEATALVGSVISATIRNNFGLFSGRHEQFPLPVFDRFQREHDELIHQTYAPNAPEDRPRVSWERLPGGPPEEDP